MLFDQNEYDHKNNSNYDATVVNQNFDIYIYMYVRATSFRMHS